MGTRSLGETRITSATERFGVENRAVASHSPFVLIVHAFLCLWGLLAAGKAVPTPHTSWTFGCHVVIGFAKTAFECRFRWIDLERGSYLLRSLVNQHPIRRTQNEPKIWNRWLTWCGHVCSCSTLLLLASEYAIAAQTWWPRSSDLDAVHAW